jgi:hypothetical protein
MHHIIEVLHRAFDLLAGGAFAVVCRFISNAITHTIFSPLVSGTIIQESATKMKVKTGFKSMSVYLCVVQCLLRAVNSSIA